MEQNKKNYCAGNFFCAGIELGYLLLLIPASKLMPMIFLGINSNYLFSKNHFADSHTDYQDF